MRALKYSSTVLAFVAAASALTIAGCGGKNETEMLNTGGGAPESVNVPKGTIRVGHPPARRPRSRKRSRTPTTTRCSSSTRSAATDASMQSTENKELKNSQAALAKLEQISQQQGTGQITLFFAEGSARLNPEQTSV